MENGDDFLKIEIKTKKNLIPKIEKNIKSLNGKGIQVGAIGSGEHAWLAGIHEYGCKIEVTPKMRAWLHYNGLHLKASTEFITIPERAFLRNGYDTNKDKVVGNASLILPDVLEGIMSEDEILEFIGTQIRDCVKTYARDLKSPANHPFTVQRKGSSNPLVNSGNMIDSIEWRKK